MFRPESVWEFTMADRVTFGVGAASELPFEVDSLGAESVLVVTDDGVVEAGIVDEVTGQLGESVEATVFAEVGPDPPLSVFEEAIEYARSVEPDLVIGLGGGSSIDVAKTASVVAEHGGDVMDYVAPPTGGGEPVPGPGLPMIAVPTTAGTGSETSPVAVISLPEEKLKVGLSSRHQYPDLALVDPALCVSLPPGPTASSGLDALAHAVESYTTRAFDAKPRAESPADRPDYDGRTAVTDLFARRAIELIAGSLRRAYNNGEDLAARRRLSLGSLLAGVAFTNAGLGAAHALAYPVAGEHHTPHGLTVATLLPEVVRFNATGAFDRYAEIAEIMGAAGGSDTQAEAAERAAEAVETLTEDLGITGGLSALGVTEAEVPQLAEQTMQIQRLLVGNPRRIEQDDVAEILRRSM